MEKFNSAKKIYEYIKEVDDSAIRGVRMNEINDYYVSNMYYNDAQKIFDDRLTAIYDLVVEGENVDAMWYYAKDEHIRNTKVPGDYIDKILPLGLTYNQVFVPLWAGLYYIKKTEGNKKLIKTMKATQALVFNSQSTAQIALFINNVFENNPEEQFQLLLDMYKDDEESIVRKFINEIQKGKEIIYSSVDRLSKYLRSEDRDFEDAMRENVFFTELMLGQTKVSRGQKFFLMDEKELLVDFFGIESFCNFLYQSDIDLKTMREFPPTYANPIIATFSTTSNKLIIDNYSTFIDENTDPEFLQKYFHSMTTTTKNLSNKNETVVSNLDEFVKVVEDAKPHIKRTSDIVFYMTPKTFEQYEKLNHTLRDNVGALKLEPSDFADYDSLRSIINYELFIDEFVDYVDKEWLSEFFSNRRLIRRDPMLRRIGRLFK